MHIRALIASLCVVAVVSGCGGRASTSTFPPPPTTNDHGAPTVVVPSSSLDAVVGQALSLDASASLDPAGGGLTFAWSVAGHPPSDAGTLTGETTATPTFTPHAAGAYVLVVQVTASDGQIASDSVVVIAKAPAPHTVITLSSDTGDYIGGGHEYRYTKADSLITVSASGGHLSVSVSGDQSWTGDFVAPRSATALAAGTYASLTRYPFHDPAVGGLDWSGEGRGCNTLTGSFTLEGVTYEGGALASVDLRFEQHCEGATPALYGEIHWTSKDTTTFAGPVNPPPAGLWAPADGSTPASGNYVYLESQGGDYIGQGWAYLYTQLDSLLSVSQPSAGHLRVSVRGDQEWTGDFQAMQNLGPLQVGYYGSLQRYPFGNPARGGLDWSGEGRGCNTLTGWFVIDSISYRGSALTAIDLRFEQHCDGTTPALHGKIHWTSQDTSSPPGPVSPPPDGLWAPAAGATPATGSYLYLESEAGDYVGAGQTLTYTPASSTLGVTLSGATRLNVTIQVNSATGYDSWNGSFQGMSGLTKLQPGYYGDLMRYPFGNPARGELDWFGEGRGCNTLTGWFVIDAITYVNGALSAVDLRFEQHCEGASPALHGQLHWVAGNGA